MHLAKTQQAKTSQRHEDAERAFRKALSFRPEEATTKHHLAITLRALGKVDAAIKLYPTSVLFAAIYTPHSVTEDAQKRSLQLFTNWTPPFEFKAHYARADANGGIAI